MDTKRIQVGFEGGQVLSLRLADEHLEPLRKAVFEGKGWTTVQTADGEVHLDSSEVVFVQGESGDQSVGFGA
ncbi:MAG: hypothetical protein ACR2NA_06250 [Solirubrobacterales bacterium]